MLDAATFGVGGGITSYVGWFTGCIAVLISSMPVRVESYALV